MSGSSSSGPQLPGTDLLPPPQLVQQPLPPLISPDEPFEAHTRKKDQLTTRKRLKKLAYGLNYISDEETIRNDYSLHYVHSGSRPQNYIQNPGLATRFAEYPKLRRLLELKQAVVANHAHPPTYLEADLRPSHPHAFNLLDLLPSRFDIVMLDPPLEEYAQSYPEITSKPPLSTCGGPPDHQRPWWTWEELEALPVPQIAASPGFIFLWCGTGQGKALEQGRALLARWGYRKCEDLVWVKTNHNRHEPGASDRPPKTNSVFTPTKEHCLMGIRGTVRRSTDGHFVNCNVDTDVIVADADPTDALHKPAEIYHVIENFCLGHRRLELFGSKRSLRRGWLTIGNQCAPDHTLRDASELPVLDRPISYVKQDYIAHFLDPSGRTQNLIPTTPEIETLRPRSPPGRIGTAIAGPSGSPLPRGLGLGMSAPGSSPMPNHPGLMGVTIPVSGRNTISHPSGGLGRGPGNALLPGMRVSGFRESGNTSSATGSAKYRNLKPTNSPRGRDHRTLPPSSIQGRQQMPQSHFGYHMSPRMQIHPGIMMGGPGAMPPLHPTNMSPFMMSNHQLYSQPPPSWPSPSPHLMGNNYGSLPFSNPNLMPHGQMSGAIQQYANNGDPQVSGFGPHFEGPRTSSGSSFIGQQVYNHQQNGASATYHQQQQPYPPTLNYPNPFFSYPPSVSPPPSSHTPNPFPAYSAQDQSTFQGAMQQYHHSPAPQQWTWGNGASQQLGGPYQAS